jgi:hypothetical protein
MFIYIALQALDIYQIVQAANGTYYIRTPKYVFSHWIRIFI